MYGVICMKKVVSNDLAIAIQLTIHLHTLVEPSYIYCYCEFENLWICNVYVLLGTEPEEKIDFDFAQNELLLNEFDSLGGNKAFVEFYLYRCQCA